MYFGGGSFGGGGVGVVAFAEKLVSTTSACLFVLDILDRPWLKFGL